MRQPSRRCERDAEELPRLRRRREDWRVAHDRQPRPLIVAERGADGTERRTDNVRGYEDGSAFDRDWQGNAGAATIAQSRTAHRRSPARAAASAFYGRPAAVGYRAEPPQRAPTQTDADRAAAREGRAHYEREQRRMIDEAQCDRQRQGQSGVLSATATAAAAARTTRACAALRARGARRAGMHRAAGNGERGRGRGRDRS